MKLIKIPYDKGSLGVNSGCAKAPEEILKQLNELFLNEAGELPVFAVDEVSVNSSNFDETHKNILAKITEAKENFIVLGGDHSITYSCFKAFSQNFKDAGIIVFDAHPDMMQSFQPPTHENFLSMLIEEGIVRKENVILVGTRTCDKEEAAFLKANKIQNYSMKSITLEGKEDVCDAIMSIAKNFGALYVSVDIDALDPAFAPGTGYIEPAGLTSRELFYFLQRIKLLKNLKGADIVEINPSKDVNKLTVKTAAKIVFELC